MSSKEWHRHTSYASPRNAYMYALYEEYEYMEKFIVPVCIEAGLGP